MPEVTSPKVNRPLVNNGAKGTEGVLRSAKSTYKGSYAKRSQSNKLAYASYDERYQYALSHGLNPENAKYWANQQYGRVSDTFWSKAGAFFGGKLNSEKFMEDSQIADNATFNQLLMSQREQEYTDPAAESERRGAAGINDALTGGSELGTGEVGSIDDTTIGAGLPEALNSLNGEGNDFFRIAETFMNGATSVLGLVTSGVDISGAIQNLDTGALNNVLDVSGKLIDQGFDPLSPAFNEFRDKEGNISWNKYFNSLHIRSPRERKIMQRLLSSQNRNAALESSAVGKRADILTGYRTYADEYEKLKSKGIGAPAFGETTYNVGGIESTLEALVANPTYGDYVNNVAKFIQLQMEANVESESYKKEYFDALSAGDEAKAKNALNKFTEAQSNLRKNSAEQVQLQLNDLIQKSAEGDWMATILLQSALSGSFNEFGLGNPMDLPKFGIEQASKVAGQLIKGLFDGVPKTTTVVKK